VTVRATYLQASGIAYLVGKHLLPHRYRAQPSSVPDELKISAGIGLRYCYFYCKSIDYLLTLLSAPASVLTTQCQFSSEYNIDWSTSVLVFVSFAQMLVSFEFMFRAFFLVSFQFNEQERRVLDSNKKEQNHVREVISNVSDKGVIIYCHPRRQGIPPLPPNYYRN
jgi:hypothetical protein